MFPNPLDRLATASSRPSLEKHPDGSWAMPCPQSAVQSHFKPSHFTACEPRFRLTQQPSESQGSSVRATCCVRCIMSPLITQNFIAPFGHNMPTSILDSLPVELVAEIFSYLDLRSLVIVSYLSKSLHTIASDPSLNPWRKPILCNLRSSVYELSLKHLSVRTIVPRQNWIEILSLARASFILFEATLPNLTSSEWEECFARRFLPGWRKWKKDGTWKEAFLKLVSVVRLKLKMTNQ